MTPERWVQIEELFHRATECEGEDRLRLLEGVDPELRREVEALLSAREGASGHLREAVREEAEAAASPSMGEPELRTIDASSASAGTIIGPYHLVNPIGEGGMGEVWLAEQKQPVRRRVALKLIKAGMDTREVIARFESERQALALMDHPAIAKVFDAGSTSQGLPYFVMEYVAGIPITDYCDKHKLTTRQRLELFAHVCEGVQHAHQKAIIHRDLKPSNILVTEVDGKPIPKIIDFGVAKAISQRLTAQTMYTRVGAVIGTMGYMSPEQADLGGEDIDTRTDVYSLGVVLYELLVGALPFDFRKIAFDEALRRLREQDAPKPSTKLRTAGADSTTTAKNRGTDVPTLVREVSGDPDAIALKALEKERARRYATPLELAADIGRYLRHEPVTAHAPSAAYRARKYIRRHRIGVAFAGAFLLLLAAAVLAQAIQLRRVTRERDRADRITQFMTNMFKVSNPSEARGNRVTAKEILDKASTDIDTGLAKDSEMRARMMYAMADSYYGLGLYSRAQPLLQRALEVQRRVLGPEHRDTLLSMSLLADVLTHEGGSAEAEKLARAALETQRRVLGPEHRDTLSSMNRLATTLYAEGHLAEAEKLARAAVEIERGLHGPEHPDTLASMRILALPVMYEGHYTEAEKLGRETLEIERRVLGPEHPGTLASMNNLALTLTLDGHYAEAERLYGELLGIQRRVLGPEHPGTLTSLEYEAYNLSLEGRYRDAEKLFREAIQTAGKANQPGVLIQAWYNFACGAAIAGRHEEALKYLGESIDHGRSNAKAMATDPDLKSLHGDPRFEALVAKARQRAASPVKPQ